MRLDHRPLRIGDMAIDLPTLFAEVDRKLEWGEGEDWF
jgi:hypothetical protein